MFDSVMMYTVFQGSISPFWNLKNVPRALEKNGVKLSITVICYKSVSHSQEKCARTNCFPWHRNDSLHLALKYARIFVRGHYLCRDTKSFSRAKLEENFKLWETDNVQGQIPEHNFAPDRGYCFYYPSNIFATRGCFRTIYCVLRIGCLLFSVLWCDFMNKQTSSITIVKRSFILN